MLAHALDDGAASAGRLATRTRPSSLSYHRKRRYPVRRAVQDRLLTGRRRARLNQSTRGPHMGAVCRPSGAGGGHAARAEHPLHHRERDAAVELDPNSIPSTSRGCVDPARPDGARRRRRTRPCRRWRGQTRTVPRTGGDPGRGDRRSRKKSKDAPGGTTIRASCMTAIACPKRVASPTASHRDHGPAASSTRIGRTIIPTRPVTAVAASSGTHEGVVEPRQQHGRHQQGHEREEPGDQQPEHVDPAEPAAAHGPCRGVTKTSAACWYTSGVAVAQPGGGTRKGRAHRDDQDWKRAGEHGRSRR